MNPQNVQTVQSVHAKAKPSFVDAKVNECILSWAFGILTSTLSKNLEEPDRHFQNYGDSSTTQSLPNITSFICSYADCLSLVAVDNYAWLVDGTAQARVDKFMSEDHSFQEYTKVK